MVCKNCGSEMNEQDLFCKKCGKTVRYCQDKTLQGINCEWPFRFTTEWYDYQSSYINGLDLVARADELLYTDHARISEVKLYDRKYPIAENAEVRLYGGKIVVAAITRVITR